MSIAGARRTGGEVVEEPSTEEPIAERNAEEDDEPLDPNEQFDGRNYFPAMRSCKICRSFVRVGVDK